MKKLSILFLVIMLFGCHRQTKRYKILSEANSRGYHIIVFIGNGNVPCEKFVGIMNAKKEYDSCYYIKDDTMFINTGK